MSIRKLLAESRQSGPATVYELDKDGIILRKYERPARSVHKAGRLSREERLCLLTQAGEWPEDHPPEASIGVQANDNHAIPMTPIREDLRQTGIMSGLRDDTADAGKDRADRA